MQKSSLTDVSTASPTESARPTRSNTKAPDIPPTPPFSIEHQLKLLEKKYQESQKK
jgi:hypothetical protein